MKTVLIILAGVIAVASAQRRPPNYAQDAMPDTSFNCRDKVVGGYYADQETDCQMFHVCVKVPGQGVQDYRFLCPNDTTFDQENQICANWYDIDCEASTLFYSDNFDLYRIDKQPAKVAPLALGPSTTRPRPVDDEEEFYLQRSETGDRRLQKDLLRGSSSGNFFNKNKGNDDDFEDVKPAKKSQPAPAPGQKKVAVRKQVRKRPEFDSNSRQSYDSTTTTTTAAAATTTTTTTERYVNRQNNRQSHRQSFRSRSTSDPSTTTFTTPSPSTYNPSTYNPSTFNSPSTYNNPSPSTYKPPTTFNNPSPSTYRPSTFNVNPSTYNPSTFNPSTSAPKRAEFQPRYNTVSRSGVPPTTPPSAFQSRNNRPRPEVPTSTTFEPVVTYNGNYKARTSTAEYQDYNGGFDSYGNQRDTSDEYVEIVKNDEEFLKTAPSNNIRPSGFNSFGKSVNDFKVTTNFNKESSSDFTKAPRQQSNQNTNFRQNTPPAFDNSQQTDFTKAPRQQQQQPQSNFRQNTPPNFSQTPQNVRTDFTKPPQNNRQRQFPSSTVNYQDTESTKTSRNPSSQYTNPQQNNRQNPTSTLNYQNSNTDFTKAPENFNRPSSVIVVQPTTPKPSGKKAVLEAKLNKETLKDASYDYAYYDDTEYEGADPISDHHFGKAGESQKLT